MSHYFNESGPDSPLTQFHVRTLGLILVIVAYVYACMYLNEVTHDTMPHCPIVVGYSWLIHVTSVSGR